MFKPNVPKYFLDALAIIDKTYRVEGTEDHNGYFIIKDLDMTLKADGGKSLIIPGKDIKLLRVRGPIPLLWIQIGRAHV